MDYVSAFQRPFQDLKKLTIGAILNGIPLLSIITGLFVTGYTAECARLTLNRKNQLPDWGGWRVLFKRGILITLIWAVYSIPFLLILLILFIKGLQALMQGLDPQTIATMLWQQNQPYLIILLLIFVLTWYYTQMAVLHYLVKYSFRDAFQFNLIFTHASHLTYLKAWILAFAYTVLIASLLQSILTTLSSDNIFLGLAYDLFSGYLTFIAAITTMTLTAQAYEEIAKPRR